MLMFHNIYTGFQLKRVNAVCDFIICYRHKMYIWEV